MHDFLNLIDYPLDQSGSQKWQALVDCCAVLLSRDGLCNLTGFVQPHAVAMSVDELKPMLETEAFTHARRHNIYFRKSIEGLSDDHPALRTFETTNRTICADQIGEAIVIKLYEWPPFARFLAAVMGKPKLFTMTDPLARVNVMAYSNGEALNWHFDRSEFTTTLLLQAPDTGGEFEYDQDLRSDDDPNYAGVADLLAGRRSPTQLKLEPGTLNIFKGKNTAHRVTPVGGDQDRIITVFSYYEQPGVEFSSQERIEFYGRTA